jgi:hypothetical protein
MQKIQDLTAALEMAESRAAAFKQGLQSPYDQFGKLPGGDSDMLVSFLFYSSLQLSIELLLARLNVVLTFYEGFTFTINLSAWYWNNILSDIHQRILIRRQA